MLFNSINFLIFFPIVTLLLFAIPKKGQIPLLLAASCYFYIAFIPKFILILFFLIIVDYFSALFIEREPSLNKKKAILILSLASNLGVLFVFKYFNFFNSNLACLFKALHLSYPEATLSLILPLGLSFHTFQSMSYTIEVYKGRFKAERNLFTYALYVLFYPQLVAGPIERPHQLLLQFHKPFKFNSEDFVSGLSLMGWGFFKKLFVADRLAIFVAEAFSKPQSLAGGSPALLLGIYFFSFQIYFDFSGYTDIARGAAQVMGIRLVENFNSPYLAPNVTQFWHRWHISLSTWFRDYLYIPLGGSRTSLEKLCFNILIVFVLSGLWHGANWTFVIWGALHGFYLIVSKLTQNLKKPFKLPRALEVLITFNLVTFAWIFFRAPSLNSARDVITGLFCGSWNFFSAIKIFSLNDQMRTGILVLVVYLFASQIKKLASLSELGRVAFLSVLITLILLGAPLNETAFIYFQF